MSPIERIKICKKLREFNAQAVINNLQQAVGLSETVFRDKLHEQLKVNQDIYESGWYAPPPQGIMALFASEKDVTRLQFDTLRKEQFWPKDNIILQNNSIAMAYASPIQKATGIIGDFGITVYNGSSQKIKQHLDKSLEIVSKTAEFSQVGMQLREIHNFSQKLLKENGLTNSRTITWTDTVGTNIGHTLAWTYEEPTAEEFEAIRNQNFEMVKEYISKKRINLNREEKFKIPETIAFTIELRIEDENDAAIPNAFFHLIVTFQEGKKEILKNF